MAVYRDRLKEKVCDLKISKFRQFIGLTKSCEYSRSKLVLILAKNSFFKDKISGERPPDHWSPC